jgi:signal transduction histidine kinase
MMSVSVISVVLTALAISAFGVYNLRMDIISDLKSWAVIGGDLNASALRFGQPKDATDHLKDFIAKKTMIQACLYDRDGDFFARYVNKRHPESHCPTDMSERVRIGDDRIELMKPIINTGDKIGYIYLESTLGEVDEYIQKQTSIASTVALAALVVSYLFAIYLQKAISRPILSLADMARQVSRDYSTRATPLGNIESEDKNELTILTDSFNDMLLQIGARNQQLQRQNIELERARDKAEGANRAKSQFLANIGHELRTPLNAIIGFSSILMNQLFGAIGDQKYLEYAKDINASGTHLLEIINDILDLSKADTGKLTLDYVEVNVGKAIQKCVSILSERAAKCNVSITTDISKTMPQLVADRLRFIQVILNIMSNAIKFTSQGGRVHITASATADDSTPVPENAQFTITIQDNGIGMASGDINKALESFGQVDSGLNRKYEGTGLGLPLTKKLMELHYGGINIESEPGKGTLVTLVFPALPPKK